MRTEELMREYAKGKTERPECFGWERLVWMAAELMNMAKRMRNTAKSAVSVKIDEPFVQEELFK